LSRALGDKKKQKNKKAGAAHLNLHQKLGTSQRKPQIVKRKRGMGAGFAIEEVRPLYG